MKETRTVKNLSLPLSNNRITEEVNKCRLVYEIVDFTTSKKFANYKRKQGYIIRAIPTSEVNFYTWQGCWNDNHTVPPSKPNHRIPSYRIRWEGLRDSWRLAEIPRHHTLKRWLPDTRRILGHVWTVTSSIGVLKMFSKQHYKTAGYILAKHQTQQELIDSFIAFFEDDNPRFDRDIFTTYIQNLSRKE